MPCKSHNGADRYPRAVIKQLASNGRSRKRRNAETRDRIMRFSNRGSSGGSAREERVFIKVPVVTKGLTHRSDLSDWWPRER